MASALPTGAYPNVAFDALDKDFTPKPSQHGVAFANITHENDEGQQMTIGSNPRFDMVGFGHVQLFDKSGDGDVKQLRNASAICDALRNKRVVGTGFVIRFMSAAPVVHPKLGDYFAREVRVRFLVNFYPTVN